MVRVGKHVAWNQHCSILMVEDFAGDKEKVEGVTRVNVEEVHGSVDVTAFKNFLGIDAINGQLHTEIEDGEATVRAK